MRFCLSSCALVVATLGLGMIGTASAAVFNDTAGENFDGNAHMDIRSVEVTNTATDITFKITLGGSIASPNDWGKYLVGIDTGAGSGDGGSPVGNPWGRNINMTAKMDAFIGSWADSGGGFQPWVFNGAAWIQNGTGTPVLGSDNTTITTSLASLGLSLGQSIGIDVYTSGGNGGDSANDAAANPSQSMSDWPGPYTSNSLLSYTIAVPEPASVAMLGLAGAVILRRRQRTA